MKYVNHWNCRYLAVPLLLAIVLSPGWDCFSEEFRVGNTTTIRADEIRIKKNENIMVFNGNISIENKGLKIFVKKTLTVHYINIDGKINPNSMDMTGLVATNPRGVKISGDRGNYDFINSILVISDNVVLKEKNTIIFADRAIYDTNTEEISVPSERDRENEVDRGILIIMDNINELENKKDDGEHSKD
ncbi:MAG: hypothetical protein LBI70_01000 [Rickettsiales bacterium]|jgi:lipopolysaccharide export system protein LptA|nr:hypothetical protein [Rickettsiales bacterium]